MKCLDIYALVEISKANKKFSHLLTESFIISDITMAEFFIVIKKEHNIQTADYWHKKFAPYCQPITREDCIQGLLYREEHKKENLSIFDAIGYVFSQQRKMSFVTGDKEFKNKPNVEFIQA